MKKTLVGKDLINDDDIAVVELVKNAYDGGANDVLLGFESFTEGKTTEVFRINQPR